jgi:hypothetical protein
LFPFMTRVEIIFPKYGLDTFPADPTIQVFKQAPSSI